jgi:hypothetical protein
MLYSTFCRKRGEGESGYNVVFGEICRTNHKSSCFKAKERTTGNVLIMYNNPIFLSGWRGERNVVCKVVVDVMYSNGNVIRKLSGQAKDEASFMSFCLYMC